MAQIITNKLSSPTDEKKEVSTGSYPYAASTMGSSSAAVTSHGNQPSCAQSNFDGRFCVEIECFCSESYIR